MAIAKELYLGILLDRAKQSVVMLMASEAGGMAIEEVAEETLREKSLKRLVDPYNRS